MSDRHRDEVVRLVTARSPASLSWRQALEGQGIPCRVVGEDLDGFGAAYPGMPSVPRPFWRRCSTAVPADDGR
jgi:hypothetical protein